MSLISGRSCNSLILRSIEVSFLAVALELGSQLFLRSGTTHPVRSSEMARKDVVKRQVLSGEWTRQPARRLPAGRMRYACASGRQGSLPNSVRWEMSDPWITERVSSPQTSTYHVIAVSRLNASHNVATCWSNPQISALPQTLRLRFAGRPAGRCCYCGRALHRG